VGGRGERWRCHCEELGAPCAPGDEAIQRPRAGLLRYARNDGGGKRRCHCEAQSDEAIQISRAGLLRYARNDRGDARNDGGGKR
jgi:hypothetical protein